MTLGLRDEILQVFLPTNILAHLPNNVIAFSLKEQPLGVVVEVLEVVCFFVGVVQVYQHLGALGFCLTHCP